MIFEREVVRRERRLYRLKSALVLLCGLLLSVCMTSPEREQLASLPVLPDQWPAKQQQPGAVLDHWLKTFADPRLMQTVRVALAGNYDLRATAARIEGAGRWPQLAIAAGYRRGDPGRDEAEGGGFEALFDLSWELDVWGRIRAAQLTSGQEAEATVADWQAARLSLVARTAQNFIELT